MLVSHTASMFDSCARTEYAPSVLVPDNAMSAAATATRPARVAMTFLRHRVAALNDPDQHGDNGQDQQNVNEAAKGVRRHHTQQPHDHEDREDGPQHASDILTRIAVHVGCHDFDRLTPDRSTPFKN